MTKAADYNLVICPSNQLLAELHFYSGVGFSGRGALGAGREEGSEQGSGAAVNWSTGPLSYQTRV